MKRPKIVVVGSSNTDMILQVPHIPRRGEPVLGGAFATAPGGKGANQAVAAARAGGDVTLVARVGTDTLGDAALDGFRRDRIAVEHVRRDPDAPSGVALIFVEAGGENSIGVASGANARLAPADVEAAGGAIRAADILLMQLETPLETIVAAARIAHQAGVCAILNPAPARDLPVDLFALLSFITPNETEAELLTGAAAADLEGAARAGRTLLARGAGAAAVTLGSRGALLVAPEGETLVPGFDVEAVDATAAGDVFNGALAVALGEGRTPREALRFANAAAALSVTRPGAQPSAPRRAEIEGFMAGRD